MAVQQFTLDGPVQIKDLHILLEQPFTFYREDQVTWPGVISQQNFERAFITGQRNLQIRFRNLPDLLPKDISHSFSGSLLPTKITINQQNTGKKLQSDTVPHTTTDTDLLISEITAMIFTIPLRFIKNISKRSLFYALCEDEAGKFLLLYFNKQDILKSTVRYVNPKTNSGGTRIPR